MKLLQKHISKSVVSLIISVALVLTASVFPASATEAKGKISYNKETYDIYSEACDALAQGLLNVESKIDLSAYKVPTSALKDVVEIVHTSYPELFFLGDAFGYGYSYSRDTGYVSYITPNYPLDSEQIGLMKSELDSAVDSFLSDISSSMSDFEKAVILHDKIALNCEYDITTDNCGSIYGVLVEGKAKCLGYAKTYSYLLSLVGIDSELVISDEMNHMWNKLCVDGSWYNADVTYDDPLMNGYDDAGYVRHNFFLLSDAAISDMADSSLNHTGFEGAYYKCTSTKYDSSVIHEINTKLCLVDGSFYMIDNTYNSKYEKSLLKYDAETDSATVIKSFSGNVWSAGTAGYYWTGGFMSLDEYNGTLYYNTVSTVNSYDISANKETVFYNGGSSASYYGMVIDGRNVYADVQESPNEPSNLVLVGTLAEIISPTTAVPTTIAPATAVPTTIAPATIAPTTVPPTTITPTTEPVETTEPVFQDMIIGDVNLDGIVTIDDATAIQKYLAELTELSSDSFARADANGDGTVSISDATSIQKYIAGIIDALG